MLDLNQLVETLDNATVTVTFTKKNGDERVMRATRNLMTIPQSAHPKTGIATPVKNNVHVFDVDKNGWRSFNFDAVKDFVVS